MMKLKETSTTALVLAALREADDFMTAKMLAEKVGRELRGPVAGALHMLRRYRAVDVVVDPDGVGWWYARPVEEDQRMRTYDEHAPHPHGMTRKRKRKGPPNERA